MIHAYNEKKDSNGVYRVTGSAFTRGRSQRSLTSSTLMPQGCGPFNAALNEIFDRFYRDGLYAVNVGFKRYKIIT